jgi:peptidoglycan/xylan/chitin deacetylase (PgdA/CDA1 family)
VRSAARTGGTRAAAWPGARWRPGASSAPSRPCAWALTELPDDDLARELDGSLADVRQRTGRDVVGLSFPHGRQDERVRSAALAAGAPWACSSRRGLNDPGTDPYALRRVEIRGHLGLRGFALALVTGRPGFRAALRERA